MYSKDMEKILKWCGLDKKHDMIEYGLHDASKDWCRKCGLNGDEVGDECNISLDMNFFFQYVVPKLEETGTGYSIEFIYNATECDSKRFECVILHEYLAVHTYFAGGNKVNIYSDKFDPNKAWKEALVKLIDNG